MNPIARAAAPAPGPESADDAKLRAACAQLEGVFMSQLMKVMRETVPEGGALDGGNGEEMFSSMLDEHMSELAAGREERGLGAALFRQLRAALAVQRATEPNGADPTVAGIPATEDA